MTVTDEPMPGVQQPGSDAIWVIAHKGGVGAELLVWGSYSNTSRNLEAAKATARSLAGEFAEVIVVIGTMNYRAWRRDDEATEAA